LCRKPAGSAWTRCSARGCWHNSTTLPKLSLVACASAHAAVRTHTHTHAQLRTHDHTRQMHQQPLSCSPQRARTHTHASTHARTCDAVHLLATLGQHHSRQLLDVKRLSQLLSWCWCWCCAHGTTAAVHVHAGWVACLP
jgi:hypothetical protein